MKILVFLIVFTTTTWSPAVIMLPPDTNNLAAVQQVLEMARQNHFYYLNGKIDRMEHEVDRIETGLIAVSVLVVSVCLAVCLLAARDRVRSRKVV